MNDRAMAIAVLCSHLCVSDGVFPLEPREYSTLVAKPDAGFNTGIAMMRNKYIYAQSDATVVIKADYNKGGTWNGAVENLKKGWSLPLCRNHLAYPGNKALIEQGAVPIDEDWDGDVEALGKERKNETAEQISVFDPPAQ